MGLRALTQRRTVWRHALDGLLSPLGRAWLRLSLLTHERAKPIGEPHEIEPQCEEFHCFGHDRDEPGRAWLVCGECFHRYGSARELRKLYRREAWRAHRRWHKDMIMSKAEDGPSTLRVLWRLATIRASKIYFCQVCIHDW